MTRTQQQLTIHQVFLLDGQNTMEHIKNPLVEDEMPTLSLFPCDVLAEGQQVALDDQYGMVGIYEKNTLLKKRDLHMREILSLALILLARPLPVSHAMLQNICKLHLMHQEKTARLEHTMLDQAVQETIRTCNEQIRYVGLHIGKSEETYHLTPASETCGSAEHASTARSRREAST